MAAQRLLPIILFFCLLLNWGIATAGCQSYDISAIISSEPYEPKGAHVGDGYGVGAGATVGITEKIALRADIGYLKFKDRLYYKRIPVFLGARYTPVEKDFFVFGELGIEANFDKEEEPDVGPVYEVNAALVPGLGVGYNLGRNFLIGVNARYHYTDDAYYTAGAFIGLRRCGKGNSGYLR